MQQNFRLDEQLKKRFDDYCDLNGFKIQRVIEALIYGAVDKSEPAPREIFELIQELAGQITKRSMVQNARKIG